MPVAVFVAGSIRVTVLPGTLVTQTAPAPTASTEAGSETWIAAVTALLVGSIRVTVRLGPFETQIDPKPLVTSRGVETGMVATSVPPGGRSARAAAAPSAAIARTMLSAIRLAFTMTCLLVVGVGSCAVWLAALEDAADCTLGILRGRDDDVEVAGVRGDLR